MESYQIYIFKVIIIQAALFAIYWLFNRNNTSYRFNRLFLLVTLVIPFIIPFIHIPLIPYDYKIIYAANAQTFSIPESYNTLAGGSHASPNDQNSNWMLAAVATIYLLISTILAIKLIYGYWQIRRLRRSSEHTELSPKGYLLHYIPTKILSFSFLNDIFLSNQYPLRQNEKNSIIAHEEFHIRQRHSLDILTTEMIRVVFWFNPIIYLIQKHLRRAHEFHTDQHISKNYSLDEYSSLLLTHKWMEFRIILGNSISGSNINRRLEMIKKSAQEPASFRILITAFSAVMMFLIMACTESLDPQKSDEPGFRFDFTDEDIEMEIQHRLTNDLKNAPEDFVKAYVDEQRNHPEYLYHTYVWTVADEEQRIWESEESKSLSIPGGKLDYPLEFLRELTKEETKIYFSARKTQVPEGVKTYALIRKVDRYKWEEHRYKMNYDDEEIHDDYDTPATFGNGDADLQKFIRDNLVYPEIAKVNGIEDKVVMRFVVTKYGGLVYLNFAELPKIQNEDISLELQIAAFRVLSATEGKWLPAQKNGKYVVSRMTVPVEFKLEE